MKRTYLALFLIPALVLPAWAQTKPAQAPKSKRSYVNASVRGTLTNTYDIYDYGLGVRMHVSAYGGNSLSFSGTPFSGSLYGNGNYYSISGGRVHGSINRLSSGYSVSATATGTEGRTLRIYFTMYANGPMDDPDRPPTFSLYGADASLRITPSYGTRQYTVSGWVDDERFGGAGTALACLVSAAVLNERGRAGKGLPDAKWLKKSPVLRPLQRGLVPVH